MTHSRDAQPAAGDRRLRWGDDGVTKLEWLGYSVAVLSLLMFIPQIRGPVGDLYGKYIWENTVASGILVGIGSFVIFAGAVFVILYTNLGARLGFLVSGAALFGFGAISGLLFVLYAPRGPRPPNVEGLNAFQIRIMPLAMMLGSAVLFAMFLAALSRYEQAGREE